VILGRAQLQQIRNYLVDDLSDLIKLALVQAETGEVKLQGDASDERQKLNRGVGEFFLDFFPDSCQRLHPGFLAAAAQTPNAASACKVLGPERLQSLTTHDGRHTFISHALAGGRTLAEVRDAAGHASIATTSVYTHVAVDDDGVVGELLA
jgi:integrase